MQLRAQLGGGGYHRGCVCASHPAVSGSTPLTAGKNIESEELPLKTYSSKFVGCKSTRERFKIANGSVSNPGWVIYEPESRPSNQSWKFFFNLFHCSNFPLNLTVIICSNQLLMSFKRHQTRQHALRSSIENNYQNRWSDLNLWPKYVCFFVHVRVPKNSICN